MAKPSGPQGPFLLHSSYEFLSEAALALLIVFSFKNLDHLLSERVNVSFEQALLPENFIAAGVRDQIAKLKPGYIVGFCLDL